MAEPSQHDWELCKENVLPIKRGRSVKGLQENTNPGLQKEKELALAEKSVEDKIRGTTLSINLLNEYTAFYKWTRDNFPSNSEKALKILEVIIAQQLH